MSQGAASYLFSASSGIWEYPSPFVTSTKIWLYTRVSHHVLIVPRTYELGGIRCGTWLLCPLAMGTRATVTSTCLVMRRGARVRALFQELCKVQNKINSDPLLSLVENPRRNSGECDLGFVSPVHMFRNICWWICSSYYCRAQVINPFRTGGEPDSVLWASYVLRS